MMPPESLIEITLIVRVQRLKFFGRAWLLGIFGVLLLPGIAFAQLKPRARDLGIRFEGIPGHLNAITDVAGVEVG